MAPLHKKNGFLLIQRWHYITFLIQSHSGPWFWTMINHQTCPSPTFLPWNWHCPTTRLEKSPFFRGFQVRSSPRQSGRRHPLVQLRCPGEAGDGRGASRPLRCGQGATGVFGGPAVPPSAAGEEAWKNVAKVAWGKSTKSLWGGLEMISGMFLWGYNLWYNGMLAMFDWTILFKYIWYIRDHKKSKSRSGELSAEGLISSHQSLCQGVWQSSTYEACVDSATDHEECY